MAVVLGKVVPRKTRSRRRGKRADRGSSAIELAILAPMLLIMIWLVVQFALWFQSRSVAVAAAQAGARMAREEAGVAGRPWQTDAVARARDYYNSLGTKILGGIQVVPVGNPGTNVGVQVTGTVSSIIPGLTLTITETSEGPVECFRPLNNGGTC
ncbi:MAG: pilus assembly protein [Streptosporangiaceae bacterium]|nr:pilus assembly protein [Streptosporangiaceae bacterium]MBV9855992.1 pilus assembly protein [Streptosporangiaceae bacterium]